MRRNQKALFAHSARYSRLEGPLLSTNTSRMGTNPPATAVWDEVLDVHTEEAEVHSRLFKRHVSGGLTLADP